MNMAMPMNNDEMDPDEGGAERTSNVTDYKRTCIDFIEDISGSYLEWVDYYSEKNQFCPQIYIRKWLLQHVAADVAEGFKRD